MELLNIENLISDSFQRFPIIQDENVVLVWRNSFIDVDQEVLLINNEILGNSQTINGLKAAFLNANNYCLKYADQPLTKNDIEGENINLETSNCECDFWVILNNINIQPRKILVLLYAIIRRSNMPKATPTNIEFSLIASALYFSLLAIKGSVAYRIFQPGIIQEIANIISHNSPEVNFKRKSGHRGGSKNKRPNTVVRETSSSDEDEKLHLEAQRCSLNFNLKKQLLRLILNSFSRMITNFSFQDHGDDLKVLIKSLINLALDQVESPVLNFNNQTLNTLAFQSLHKCINRNFHGSSINIYLEIITNLLFASLEIFSEKKFNQKESFQINHIHIFIKYLIETGDDEAIHSTKIYFQQICVRASDKSDLRERTAQIMYKFIRNLNLELFADLITWIVKFSWQPETNHKLVALDVLSMLFLDIEMTEKIAGLSNLHPLQIIEKILYRCNDKTSTVIVKAITVLSQENVIKYLTRISNTSTNGENHQYIENSSNEIIEMQRVLYKKLINFCTILSKNEKVYVRKSTLCLLTQLMRFCKGEPRETFFKILGEFALDPSLMIRKQFCQSVTVILSAHSNSENAQKLFTKDTLPLLGDCEQTVQDKCLEQVEAIIFKGIMADNEHTWLLLTKFCHDNISEHQGYLRKALKMWIKNGLVNSTFVKRLKNQIASKYEDVAWVLLSHMTSCSNFPDLDYTFILHSWRDKKNNLKKADEIILKNIIETIGNCAAKLPKKSVDGMIEYFQRDIAEFSLPLITITPTVNAIKKMLSVLDTDPEINKMIMTTFATNTIKRCDALFTQFLETETFVAIEAREEEFIKIIETYNILSEQCPNAISTQTQHFMQSLAIQRHKENDSVKKIAIVTLGSFCIQNERLAQDSLLLFIRELKEATNPNVIINILSVLCDFCVCYPSMIDPYLTVMTGCLKNSSKFVCYQSLTLLTRLLQEDYLKWKGSLFFRILYLVAHPDKELCRYAKFILVHLLVKRFPNFFIQHFVEAMFFLNGLEKTMETFTDKQNLDFALKGEDNFYRRMTIYSFMLENMPSVKFFKINSQLVCLVLEKFINKEVDLNKENGVVIKDTLKILSSEELKSSNYAQDENLATNSENNKNAYSKEVRRVVVEKIINVVLHLRPIISKTPLIKDFKNFFKNFTKDYRNEIKDLLNQDPQLALELDYENLNADK